MIDTIVATLLPIIVTLALGFFAGWHQDFNQAQANLINKMVLLYALPLMLFTGVFQTPPAMLVSDLKVLAWTGGAMLGCFALVLCAARFMGRVETPAAALYALCVSGPAVPFVGPAVLDEIFPAQADAAVAIGSSLLNLVLVPIALFLIVRHQAAGEKQTSAGAAAWRALRMAFAQPLVWAPILAFALVACGVELPKMLGRSMMLLGAATSGAALFAVGAILFAQKVSLSWPVAFTVLSKNILLPLGVLFLFSTFDGGGHREKALIITTLALPSASISVILAVQYQILTKQMASNLFFSTLLSMVTMGGFIWVTHP